jgi:hypothetical protein
MDFIFNFLHNNYIRLKFLPNNEINMQFFTDEQAERINYVPNNKCVKIINGKEKTVDIIEYHEGNEIIITSVEFSGDHIIIIINNSNKNFLEILQKIPGAPFSIRIDTANTSTHTQKHAHIFDSKGNDLYQVNEDGSAHHGDSRDKKIHKKVFDHLKQKGFNLNDDRYISFVTIYEFHANYFLYELKQKIEEGNANVPDTRIV